jgi:ribokinase
MDLVVSAHRIPEIGETISGHDFHTIPGGKGANQAVGCAKLGADVAMLGAVGNDSYGKAIVESLLSYGVATDNIAILADKTGIASIIHTSTDNCIIVVPGANAAFDTERLAALEPQIARAGVLLVQLEIDIKTVERALEVAKSNGVTTILNPAPAVSLPERMLRLADFVTPNETELEVLCGHKISGEAELEQVLAGWNERYGGQLIVTRGAAGCSYYSEGRLHTVPALSVEVVDTTGAGDAFNGALAHCLAQGWPMEKAVPFAVATSSLSVTRFGAQAGMPRLQEVLERLSGS